MEVLVKNMRIRLGWTRREALLLAHGLWRGLLLPSVFSRWVRQTGPTQRPLTWVTEIPSVANAGELIMLLERRGIQYVQGKHTVYLPPNPRLADLLGGAVAFYPPDAGFKILKDMRPPGQARYSSPGPQSYAEELLRGSAHQKMQAACYLWARGLGPIVYDLTELRTTGGQAMTAFVVQDVAGEMAAIEESRSFIRRFDELIHLGEVVAILPFWKETRDFTDAGGAGNLIRAASNGQVYYVDFEEFHVKRARVIRHILHERPGDLHFGREWLFRGSRHPYQSIPGAGGLGKRDTLARWNLIRELMISAGASLRGRVVVDIGCNAGMVLSMALAEGALWGIGWDLPKVTEAARVLLPALAFSRFTLHGAVLSQFYPLAEDIPARLGPFLGEAVVFHLSMRKHVGFPQNLREIPWRWMVYEGHEGDQHADLEKHLEPLRRLTPFVTSSMRQYRDIVGRARTVALLERQGYANSTMG